MTITPVDQAHQSETERFARCIAQRGLRHSRPRERIATVFLAADRHLTAEELAALARRGGATLGMATVYRTLKLLVACGLCRELRLDDGTTRFEPRHGEEHHDHLICTACGSLVEVFDAEIERLQERLCRQHGFSPQRHRMEIYGCCRRCRTATGGARRDWEGPRS